MESPQEEGARVEETLPVLLFSEAEVDALEERVPPIGGIWSFVKRWLSALKYAILLLIINAVAIGFAFHFWDSATSKYRNHKYSEARTDDFYMDRDDEYFYSNQSSSYETGYTEYMAVSCGLFCITFLVDTFVCFMAARHFERLFDTARADTPATETTLNDTGETTGSEDAINFIKVSKSIDASFRHSTESASHTSLVCLLYALFAMSAWMALVSSIRLVRIPLEPDRCTFAKVEREFRWNNGGGEYTDPVTSELHELIMKNISTNVPADVQTWVDQTTRSPGSGPPGSGRAALNLSSYLELDDGSVVFPVNSLKGARIVKYFADNQSAVEFPLAYLPASFDGGNTDDRIRNYEISGDEFERFPPWLIAFPQSAPYIGWCGLQRDFMYGWRNFVVCSSINKTDVQAFETSGDSNQFYTTEDELWLLTRASGPLGSDRWSQYFRYYVSMILTSIDVSGLRQTVHAQVNYTYSDEIYQSWEVSNYDPEFIDPTCVAESWVQNGLGIIALLILSWYLYRMDVASCTVPMVTSVAAVLWLGAYSTTPLVLAVLSHVVIFLRMIMGSQRAKCSVLLKRFVAVASMDWAMYSLLLGSASVAFVMSEGQFYIPGIRQMVLGAYVLVAVGILAVALLLDHPIFFIAAAVILVASLIMSGILMITIGIRGILLLFVMLCFSLGFYHLGRLLRTYRVHMFVYGRRCFRWMRSRVVTSRPRTEE